MNEMFNSPVLPSCSVLTTAFGRFAIIPAVIIKEMIILGIAISHNASASLMINGKITIVAQEERFTKQKSFCGYPKKSIDYI